MKLTSKGKFYLNELERGSKKRVKIQPVLIDGMKINNDDYYIAAFDNDECVGLSKPYKFPLNDSYVFGLKQYVTFNSKNKKGLFSPSNNVSVTVE